LSKTTIPDGIIQFIKVCFNPGMTLKLNTSNNQRLGSALDTITVIPGRNSLADFHLSSPAKINIFFKKKNSHPDILQAYIAQSQNQRQYFPVVF